MHDSLPRLDIAGKHGSVGLLKKVRSVILSTAKNLLDADSRELEDPSLRSELALSLSKG
jgi:hypothetical protein